ncbi:MAG: hypothetical protein LUM44_01905 [Pyrinomonadaceae bacterium]|nr:hypothetical protein [Pyrinomonadaceae bacterium]
MKIKVLLLLCLSAILFLGACGGKEANTNTNVAVASPTPTPIPKTTESAATDPNLKPKIEEALKKGGFSDVTVDTSGPKVVIRGTVAKGKLPEVVKTVMEANGGKPVDNQVTEK